MLDGVVFREIECKSALTRVQGMPFDWSLNPYRGCTRACRYCYSRAYHSKMDRDIGRGFDSEIDVKVNFAAVLRRELARKRDRSEAVALGTGTDPYQHCEGKYRITRKTLEVIADYPVPFSIVTKSSLIVRDIDVLADISRKTGGDVRIFFSVSTLDPAIWRKNEPRTTPPEKRLEAMRRLREAGITAGVLCAPILPGMTDSEDHLDAVARATYEHGGSFWGSRVLKLDPEIKDYYLAFVATEFAPLLASYSELFAGGAHADRAYQRELERRIRAVRARYPFPGDRVEHERRSVAPEPQMQLTLAL